MKKLTFGLLVALLTLCACSQDETMDDTCRQSTTSSCASETRTVRLNITRSADVDISQVTIYVYVSERKKDSLVYSQTLQLGDGNLQLPLPLGESLKAFAVANQDSMSDEDSLATVTIHQNASASNEVYLSDIVSFSSDYTTSNVNMELKRIVGQMIVQPSETDLSSAAFDSADVTLSSVGLAYKVSTGEVTTGEITLSSDASKSWMASAYSFPTTAAGESAKIFMAFFKNGAQVNTSAASIDTENTIAASTRYIVTLPYLDDEYVDTPWMRSASKKRFSVTTTNM